jgi:hypothetical protein
MAKKETDYIQCALKRKEYHHMAWIPEKFAVVGKFIKIKKKNDEWEDGWEVIGASKEVKKTAKEADDASQLYKKTRICSDI